MSKDTFNRKEVKYRLTGEQLEMLKRASEEHLPAGEYGRTVVNSIYLDTRERSVIARSLEKPLYKEKLRVRWYGAQRLEDAAAVFIELKKKFDGVVYKRRLQVSAASARSFLNGGSCMTLDAAGLSGAEGEPTFQHIQIAREIEEARRRLGCVRPSVLISCERTSFGSDDEGALRITFDERLRALGMFDGESRFQLMASDHAIMEAKCMRAFPSWLVHALSDAKAYPSSFSKYGAFYQIMCERAGAKEEIHA